MANQEHAERGIIKTEPRKFRKFIDDIIIAGDKGEIWRIQPDDLEKFRVDQTTVDKSKDYTIIKDLLSQGVAAAAIPPEEEASSSFACACYLFNLAQLHKHTRWEPSS